MNSNETTMSQFKDNIESCCLKNKGFLLLDEMFKENNWVNIRNVFEQITYTKVGYETEYFDIKIDKTKIHVSVPIKNTPYQYKTSFTNYYDASEYVEKRFSDFIC